MKRKFDAIVVGAGPAGTTVAYLLAKSGMDVVLLERGEYPGSKNMFGGVLYGAVLKEVIPSFWEEAPVERYVTRRVISFMSLEASFSVDFKTANFGQPPYNGFTILRPKFDHWYASKAQEVGAFLVPETVVDDLIWENHKVVGVRTRRENGDLYAPVVIAADGANSLLAKQAGLRGDFEATQMGVGAKEVLGLGRKAIEERFNLTGDEGVENVFIGYCTGNVLGGGFLYTNRDSISIGIVTSVSSLVEGEMKPYELLDQFKRHPAIEPLLKDGIIREYSAHMVPKGGWKKLVKLHTDGMLVVGDAAGFVFATGLFLEGMNYAIASGIAAAETVKRAKEEGDFSNRALSRYQQLLKESFVLKDLKKFKRAPGFLSKARVQGVYPSLVCHAAEQLFTVDTQPRKKIMEIALAGLKREKLPMWQFISDLIEGGRALVW